MLLKTLRPPSGDCIENAINSRAGRKQEDIYTSGKHRSRASTGAIPGSGSPEERTADGALG